MPGDPATIRVALTLLILMPGWAQSQTLPSTRTQVQQAPSGVTVRVDTAFEPALGRAVVSTHRGDEKAWSASVPYAPELARAASSGSAVLVGYETDFNGRSARFGDPHDESSLFITILSPAGETLCHERVPRGSKQYNMNPPGPALPYAHSAVWDPAGSSLGVVLVMGKEAPPEVRWFDAETGAPQSTQRLEPPETTGERMYSSAVDVCFLESGGALTELWTSLNLSDEKGWRKLVRVVSRDPAVRGHAMVLENPFLFRFLSVELLTETGGEGLDFACTLGDTDEGETLIVFHRDDGEGGTGPNWKIMPEAQDAQDRGGRRDD